MGRGGVACGLKLTPGKVNSTHRRFEAAVKDDVGYAVRVKDQAAADWRQLSEGRCVDFMAVPGASDRADFAPDGGRFVLPLSEDKWRRREACAWAAWHERWRSDGQGRFDLCQAAWTFFYGLPGPERRKDQVCRAEWADYTSSAHDAAQPHWHFDLHYSFGMVSASDAGFGLRAGSVDSDGDGIPGGIGHIADPSASTFQIGRVHFGMGGWENAAEPPACWQRGFGGREEAFIIWASRTLKHAMTQLDFNMQP